MKILTNKKFKRLVESIKIDANNTIYHRIREESNTKEKHVKSYNIVDRLGNQSVITADEVLSVDNRLSFFMRDNFVATFLDYSSYLSIDGEV